MGIALSRAVAAAFIALASSSSAAEASDASAIVVEYAEQAIDKGYGDMCSLAMEPSPSDGYYPCLDFGPYRYVRAYGKVAAFVVQKGMPPFKVMEGTKFDSNFLVAGPWEGDMAQKMVGFWNDVVSGGAAKQKSAEADAARKTAAEAYINSLSAKEKPMPAEKPKVAPVNPEPAQDDVLSDPVGQPITDADLMNALGAVAAPQQ